MTQTISCFALMEYCLVKEWVQKLCKLIKVYNFLLQDYYYELIRPFPAIQSKEFFINQALGILS